MAVVNDVIELCILQGWNCEVLQQHAQLLPAGVAVVNAVIELCILQGRNCEVLQQHAQLFPAGVALLGLHH